MVLPYNHMQLIVAALACLLSAVLSYSKQRAEPISPKFNSGALQFLRILVQEGGTTVGATYIIQNFGVLAGLAFYLSVQALVLKGFEYAPSLILKTWLLSTPQGALLVIWTSIVQEAVCGALPALRYQRLHIKSRTVVILACVAAFATVLALSTAEGLIKVYSLTIVFWVLSRLILLRANSYRAIFFLAPQALVQTSQRLQELQGSLVPLALVSRFLLSVLVSGFAYLQVPQLPLILGVPLVGLSALASILTHKRGKPGTRREMPDSPVKVRRLLVVIFWIVLLLLLIRSTLGESGFVTVSVCLMATLIWFDGGDVSYLFSWLLGWVPLFATLPNVVAEFSLGAAAGTLILFALLETCISPFLAHEWSWSYRTSQLESEE